MASSLPNTGDQHVARLTCTRCGTELAPSLLSCPSCHALVHAATLKQLAEDAESAAAAGDLERSREAWRQALMLLPDGSQQSAIISARVTELSKRIDAAASPVAQLRAPSQPNQPWWKRVGAAIVTGVALLLGKLKLLLLGLTKVKTLFSMLLFFAVYWQLYGWGFAAGLVVSIYIHEMGHIAELRRQGIEASAPMFIPGLGALVLLKMHIDDPRVDARIGLAGPLWGLGAGIVAYGVYIATGNHTWGAIAQATGWLNLFNLIPVWQLDGSRGFHALTRVQRWIVVAVLAAMFMVTSQGLLLIVALVGAYRAFQQGAAEPDQTTLATFVLLVIALSWLGSRAVPGLAF